MKRFQYSQAEKEIMESSVIPFAVYQFIDQRVVTVLLTKGFMDFFGIEDKDEAYYIMDNHMYKDAHPDDVARISDDALRFATGQIPEYNVIYRSLKDGEYRVVHAFGKHISPKEGVRVAMIWYVNEGSYMGDELIHDDSLTRNYSISLYESSLSRKNNYDFLTGLPNMTYFYELARSNREIAVENGRNCALGFANLNGMKYYNKKYGFLEGDRMLRNFAELLTEHFGINNSCRIAQDSFAFFYDGDGPEKHVAKLFDEFALRCGDKPITVRAGIYLSTMGIVETSIACDRARYACNTLKNSNRSAYAFFDEEMLAYENNRQYIVDNIEKALSERWIQAYYQPIVRTANGRVCDEEALARWVDPVKGILSPADFIPVLEDARLIYKVDLYIVDQILERIRKQEKDGLFVVPVSVNLSRTDFDEADIVDEICRRVDASGVSRDKLTIEITESVVGTDFDYMKKQVERFRELGFHVWMDDFGSGYSSLDLLQEIHFDLIKLDMRFMKQFDNGDKSKVIVTEIMKMANALGIETVAEGVEKKEQVEFLREVGCTKLQGYYYTKPLPYEEIVRRNLEGRQIGFENPDESDYYEALGRINLYDMAVVANEEPESFDQYFDMLPMAIVECTKDNFKVVRSNKTYKQFLEKVFGTLVVGVDIDYTLFDSMDGIPFTNALKQCVDGEQKVFVDEQIGKDTNIHAFVRNIASNPVTGVVACTVVVLGLVKDSGRGVTYADIANSLSADYIYLYYVNLETEEFIEYRPDSLGGNLTVERHGKRFFATSRKDAYDHIYRDDVDNFVATFNKRTVIKAMDDHGSFTVTYRLIIDGMPTYVHLKAIYMSNDHTHMIVGVNNVDAHMRQREMFERMKEEQITYSRISALTGNYICIYTVDPNTDKYTEYGATTEYSELRLDKIGKDFFKKAREESKRVVYKDDVEELKKQFTKENVLREINECGVFIYKYRLLINGRPTFVRLKAVMVEEKDGPQIIIGVSNVDLQERRDHKDLTEV